MSEVKTFEDAVKLAGVVLLLAAKETANQLNEGEPSIRVNYTHTGAEIRVVWADGTEDEQGCEITRIADQQAITE